MNAGKEGTIAAGASKILIVDDEPNSLKFMSVLLASEGYDFDTAANGKAGLEKAHSWRPDVILLDIMMPGMSGLEVIEQLKSTGDTRHIPIIITTAHGDTDMRINCLKAGVNDFLIKPIDTEELRMRLNNILQVKRFEELKVKNEILREAQISLEEKNVALEKAYSDLKMAQSQILQQEKLASIGQLAAGIAHEINNPVGYIISNIGSLKKYVEKLKAFIEAQGGAINDLCSSGSEEDAICKLSEQRQNLKIDLILEDINAVFAETFVGAERVKQIIQDLKMFSHADSDELKMADIHSGLDSTLNVIWNELKYKTEVIKEYGDIPRTKCNLGQLNQVFMNLLVNAAHAIEKRGVITVTTRSDEGNIYIAISDTGSGIPKELLAKIFDPFFTTKEVGKGTGLGLSIASDILRKHNGEITVQSEVGKGTEFSMRIPIVLS
jgi:signal transduction histidine kinase